MSGLQRNPKNSSVITIVKKEWDQKSSPAHRLNQSCWRFPMQNLPTFWKYTMAWPVLNWKRHWGAYDMPISLAIRSISSLVGSLGGSTCSCNRWLVLGTATVIWTNPLQTWMKDRNWNHQKPLIIIIIGHFNQLQQELPVWTSGLVTPVVIFKTHSRFATPRCAAGRNLPGPMPSGEWSFILCSAPLVSKGGRSSVTCRASFWEKLPYIWNDSICWPKNSWTTCRFTHSASSSNTKQSHTTWIYTWIKHTCHP